MKEYMFYVENDGGTLPAEAEQELLTQCELYIEDLRRRGRLVGAQPLGEEGAILSHPFGVWREKPLSRLGPIHAGYYLVRARDLEEAIALAKQNPEFAFRPSAAIEIHSVKTEEECTGDAYPDGGSPS